MQNNISGWKQALWICRKELLLEWRSKQSVGILWMFALTTLSVVSMTLGQQPLEPEFLSAFLWIVLFFSALSGLAQVFLREQQTGTIFGLRIYGCAQPVFFGKLGYNFLLLLSLALFILPLFSFFLSMKAEHWAVLLLTLCLGLLGVAVVMTLLAALLLAARGAGSLLLILSFPLLLPLLLVCILLTTQALLPEAGNGDGLLLFLLAYDAAMLGAASVFFDFIW